MKIRKTIFGVAMWVAIATGAVISAEDAPFTVALPEGYAPFTTQAQTSQSGEGKIVTTNWISKAPSGEAVVITVSEMPGKILDPKKMMDSTRDALLKSVKATLESEEPRPGESASERLTFRSDAAVFRARFTVVDNRFYQVLYVGRTPEQRSAAAVQQLFDSFKINTPPAS